MAVPPIDPSQRVLMGPGPANVHPRVFRAMTAPVLGHLDPEYVSLLDEVSASLKRVFRAPSHPLTLFAPGTGSAGMEACLINLVEPGDRVVIGVNGYFGERLVDMATRYGARVARVDAPWGEPVPAAALERELERERADVVALVHGETSTGVLQPMEEVAGVVRRHGALLLLDTVTSLGTAAVELDRWGVDAAYSCSQKGLGCVSGLAPITFSERALDRMRRRREPVRSWYLDVGLLEKYWGPSRVYHHTSCSTLTYALAEALAIVEEEGLEARVGRHRDNAAALVRGLERMGLEPAVAAEWRLPALTVVRVPEGVSDGTMRKYLLEAYNLEIGGALGDLKGKAWRIGLMGYGSNASHIALCLAALETGLSSQGHPVPEGAIRSALAHAG